MYNGLISPPGLEWQEDKTAATIRFVVSAEQFLIQNPNSEYVSELEKFVSELKVGKQVLTKWFTIQDFIDTFKMYIVFSSAPGVDNFPLAVFKTLEKAKTFTGGDCYFQIGEVVWDGEGRIPLVRDCKIIK